MTEIDPNGAGPARPQPLVLFTTIAVGAVLMIAVLLVFAGGGSPEGSAVTTVSSRPAGSTTTTVVAPPAKPAAPPPPSAGESAKPPPAAAVTHRAPAVSVERMIGQKIMVGFRQQATPPPALLSAIRAGRVGGVILFSENNGAGKGYSSVVRTLQSAARRGHNPRLLISIDQEGGSVRRMSDAPPDLSPAAMGTQGAPTSRQQGRATGDALHARGINVNLAPVADVPDSSASFLGDRTFGTSAATVSQTAGAFARGLQAARVAATAKHYPGLGTTGAHNTDTEVVTVATPAGGLTARAKPFHRLVEDGVRLVMVSNAIYSALDPSHPAVLSRQIVEGRLRAFFPDGVVISDALEAPAVARYGGAQAPVLASKAGVDVLLYTDTSAAGAYDTLLGAYRNGNLTRTRIKDSYDRIIKLKEWIAGR